MLPEIFVSAKAAPAKATDAIAVVVNSFFHYISP